MRSPLARALCALLLLAVVACGGEDDAAREPRDGASEGTQDTSGGGRAVDPTEAIDLGHGPPPMVIDAEDAETLDFPILLVGTDGVVRQATDAASLRAILDPEDETVRHVRLFYATDRNREEPGLGTIVEPLLPAVGALLAAYLLTRLLRRALRDEARAVAYVVGGVAFIAAGGLVFRGTTIALETLRLSRYTDVLYGSERSPTGQLELGVVLVSIPVQNHEVARIESPSLLRGEVFPDPLRHFVIQEVQPLVPEAFWDRLADAVTESKHNEACVFVHGYNNTFAYAAMRLAQIVYDVGFDGAPILYSWPSKGAAALYTYDRENADWSANNLGLFLTELQERSGAERIHLIAHSMGSKVATTAVLRAIPETPEGERPFFHEIILAAPDIDAETFERFLAPELTERAERVTLYASERDEALLASVQVNGQRRAGMAGDDLVIVHGMDTVDVSRVAGGHAYIADSGRVLGDLVELVRSALPAEERTTLEEREREDARYWEIVAPR